MLAIRLFSEGSEGTNTGLSWLLFAGVGVFLLVVIVGWLSSARKQEQVPVKHEVKSHHDDGPAKAANPKKVVAAGAAAKLTSKKDTASKKATTKRPPVIKK